MVARSVSTARSANLLNSRFDCPEPSARQSQRRRHKCPHPGRGRQPDVAEPVFPHIYGVRLLSPEIRLLRLFILTSAKRLTNYPTLNSTRSSALRERGLKHDARSEEITLAAAAGRGE